MDLCGSVFVSNDYSEFFFKCINCDASIEMLKSWPDFMEHVKNCVVYLKEELNSDVENQIDPFPDEPPLPMELVKDDLKIESLEDNMACTEEDDNCQFELRYSSEEEDTTEDSNETSKIASPRFIISFHRRNKSTLAFIDFYKSHPCLWDKLNPKFKDPTSTKAAIQAIIEAINEEFKAQLTEIKIKDLIGKVRKHYHDTQKSLKKKRQKKLNSLMMNYYEKCSFLGVIDDDEMEDEDINTGSKKKFLIFANFTKPVTEAFIELYSRYPMLYDYDHPDFSSNTKKKEAYNSFSETFKQEHGITLTPEQAYKNIKSLRHWYYRTCERKKSGERIYKHELKYLELCSFLPSDAKIPKLECEICHNFFASMKTLQVHQFDVHQVGEMPFKCEECNRSFPQRSTYTLHIQRRHTAKSFECEFCHRKFSVKADHRLHVRTHTNEKPFICEICGKAFRIRTQLSYHVTAIHTKVRAFKCTMCPKDFLKQVHLRDHIKSHLNIRDKICETCGKGFTNCHSLIRHRQIHSEVKKFECKLCDAKFHQFVGLNSHMKRTHNIVKNKPKT